MLFICVKANVGTGTFAAIKIDEAIGNFFFRLFDVMSETCSLADYCDGISI